MATSWRLRYALMSKVAPFSTWNWWVEIERPLFPGFAPITIARYLRQSKGRDRGRKSWWQRWRRRRSAADWVGVCLTLLPSSVQRTVALLSYLPVDVAAAHHELRPLLTSDGERQKVVLSRLILNHCQNFAL